MSEPLDLPKGLVFFPPGTPAPRRRRRMLFVGVLMAAAVALVWPVYTMFSGIYPLILGLPLSLVWPIGWLTVMFAALVWLYRSES